jgi:hypothetical protein
VGGAAIALWSAKKTDLCHPVIKYFMDQVALQPMSPHRGEIFIVSFWSTIACGSSITILGAISGGVVTYLLVQSVSKRIFK